MLWARTLLSVAVGVLYLGTLLPGGFWLDTSEFIAGVHTLGVVHPPGHPLYVMLAKFLSLLLPFGDIAFRINLFSALTGVGCALLVAEIVRILVDAVSERQIIGAAWLGAAAGWLFATTSGAWMQGIRAEVYALNTLLILLAILFAMRFWDRKSHGAAYAFSATIGLALCNHHYLTFFFLPAPLLMLASTQNGRDLLSSRRCLVACSLVMCGLLAYAYLPIRAATDPVVNWGDPTTLERFFDVLTAKTFQGSVGAEASTISVGDNLGIAMGMMAGQLSLVGFLAAIIAYVFLWRRARPIAILLVAIVVFNCFTKAIMMIDPNNPDDYGYLMTGTAILVVGIGVLPAFFPHHIVIGACATALAIGGGSLAIAEYPTLNLSNERSAETVVDASLERQPPNSVALVNFYSEFFNFWNAQLVYGKRPDITLVHATFDSKRYKGAPYIASLARRAPHLSELLLQYQKEGRFPAEALLNLSRTRPVFLEPMVDNVMAPEPYTNPGLLWQIQATNSSSNLRVQDERFWTQVTKQLTFDSALHPEALKVLSFSHFLQGILSLRKGNPTLTKTIIKRARKLGAKSPKFDELHSISTLIEKAGNSGRFRELDAYRLLNLH